jgi:hypothetical protein
VLALIDKGAPVSVTSDVIDRLADAGVAAEAMCFTDFPTETREEALDTLRFLDARRDRVAVYIVGEFGLTHGSLVAQDPKRFDIAEVWQLVGDQLGLSLFFEPVQPWKDHDDRALVDDALDALSSGWTLRPYPWAGAVSTAHTLLHYDRFGSGVFRERATAQARGPILGARTFEAPARFELRRLEVAEQREGAIWYALVHDERSVSREAYAERASKIAPVRERPATYRFAAESPPVAAARPTSAGRRPSHSHNSTR